jgi:hypothetical protein
MQDGESIFNVEFKLTDQEIEEFYSEVKSSLNGTLPIKLTLGKKAPGFWVSKKGPGGVSAIQKIGSNRQLRREAHQHQLHPCGPYC